MRRFGAMIGVVVIGAFSASMMIGGAGAATGDLVKETIIDRPDDSACASNDAAGNHSAVGTGVAFDGENLVVSCWNDEFLSTHDPVSGALVDRIDLTLADTDDISTLGSVGALAWDEGRQTLWTCVSYSWVAQTNLSTGSIDTIFETTGGCIDGLAYDGSDDTIWASGDARNTTEHYQIDGTPLSSQANGINNSGIAVGGDLLYLADNSAQKQVVSGPKDFSNFQNFATLDRRLEDLECDNISFAAQGQTVMWVQDAYDNIYTAFEIPDGSCFFGGQATPPTTTTTTTAPPTETTTTTAPPAVLAETEQAPRADPVAAQPRFTG